MLQRRSRVTEAAAWEDRSGNPTPALTASKWHLPCLEPHFLPQTCYDNKCDCNVITSINAEWQIILSQVLLLSPVVSEKRNCVLPHLMITHGLPFTESVPGAARGTVRAHISKTLTCASKSACYSALFFSR